MARTTCRFVAFAILIFVVGASMEIASGQTPRSNDNSEARPPVTKGDLEIVKRAQEILNSPAKWKRGDNRVCPPSANTLSLYCALEVATQEVTGAFEHRGAAMQEARFVVDDIAPNAKNYHHRLMDYNNDPTTTFADVQRFFKLLEDRISLRLKQEPPGYHE
jgi:hypothetical protein